MMRGRRVCVDVSIALAFGATVHYIGAISKHEYPAPGSPGPRHKGRHMFIARAAVAAAAIAAPLAFAAPAMAQPTVTFDCSPCTGAPWTDFFNAVAPWEPFFESTNGVPDDGKGAWESGVEAVNGGAWEKAFPPAP